MRIRKNRTGLKEIVIVAALTASRLIFPSNVHSSAVVEEALRHPEGIESKTESPLNGENGEQNSMYTEYSEEELIIEEKVSEDIQEDIYHENDSKIPGDVEKDVPYVLEIDETEEDIPEVSNDYFEEKTNGLIGKLKGDESLSIDTDEKDVPYVLEIDETEEDIPKVKNDYFEGKINGLVGKLKGDESLSIDTDEKDVAGKIEDREEIKETDYLEEIEEKAEKSEKLEPKEPLPLSILSGVEYSGNFDSIGPFVGLRLGGAERDINAAIKVGFQKGFSEYVTTETGPTSPVGIYGKNTVNKEDSSLISLGGQIYMGGNFKFFFGGDYVSQRYVENEQVQILKEISGGEDQILNSSSNSTIRYEDIIRFYGGLDFPSPIKSLRIEGRAGLEQSLSDSGKNSPNVYFGVGATFNPFIQSSSKNKYEGK